MTEQLRIKDSKSICCHGFIDFLQEIIACTKDGWILDLRSQFAPQFMIGIFVANFYKVEDEIVEEDIPTEQTKPKRSYIKSEKAKEALKAKLPAEATATITQ